MCMPSIKRPQAPKPADAPERTQTADMLKMNTRQRPDNGAVGPNTMRNRSTLRTDLRPTSSGAGMNPARMG